MSDPKSRLSTRVQLFTRATADAFNRAIGEVFDARSPWQLLYRLRRIVFLGLVLYLGWILVVVQPDLARRLMLPPHPAVPGALCPAPGSGGGGAAGGGGGPRLWPPRPVRGRMGWGRHPQVLAAEGRTPQLPLEPGDDVLPRVAAMARVMGHVALGLCDGERPAALGLDADQLPTGNTVMVCPIGCAVPSTEQGVLVRVYGAAQVQEEQRARRQREQLMVLARRLAGVMQ